MRKYRFPCKDRKLPIWTANISICLNGIHKSQGLVPESRRSILLSAIKIMFICHWAVACLLSVARAQEGPQFNILQKEMLVKEGGGGGRWSQMAWGRDMPVHTLCSHCPVVSCRSVDHETHNSLGTGFWVLGLAIIFTGSSSSQERGGLCGRRSFPEIQSDWAVQRGSRNQKLLESVREMGNQRASLS